MSNSISIGRYYPAKSNIHSLNAFTKLICLIILVIISVISNSLELSIIMTVISMLLILLTNVPIILYIKSVLSMKWIIVFIIIINFIFKTEVLISIVTISKILVLILLSSILTFTTKTDSLTKGLEKLLCPLSYLKFPVKEVALSLSLGIKFIPMILDEGNRILKSLLARGIDYKKISFIEKIELLKAIIFPIFNASMNKADTLAQAMELRYYDFNSEKSSYRSYKTNQVDYVIIGIFILFLILAVVKEVF